MNAIDKYENYSASEYYDAITLFPENSAEAVYYLLKHRLSRALCRVYELHGFGLEDHYDDTIDDFFLYLYDHLDGTPFAILLTIRDKQALFGWIVGTYRHFLLNKAKEELKRRDLMENVAAFTMDEEGLLSEEVLMRLIVTAIAFFDQELQPLKRFIFYRMLLTILEPRLAVPQEKIALAMDMHPVTYRVYVNRLRMRLSHTVADLEKGLELPLNGEHLLMRSRLFQGFDHLYDTLIPYYEAALDALADASKLKALRNSCGPDGIIMHEESEYHYNRIIDARELYNILKS